jgi:hypothetical protein
VSVPEVSKMWARLPTPSSNPCFIRVRSVAEIPYVHEGN